MNWAEAKGIVEDFRLEMERRRNMSIGTMDFSDALGELKNGKRLGRKSWGGPFVMYQAGYPNGIPINKNTSIASGMPEGTLCRFSPYFMMLGLDGIFVPWLPNVADLLATDWQIMGNG